MAASRADFRRIAYRLATARPVDVTSHVADHLGTPCTGADYPLAHEVWTRTRDHVADALAECNPAFKRDLFIAATEARRLSTAMHGA